MIRQRMNYQLVVRVARFLIFSSVPLFVSEWSENSSSATQARSTTKIFGSSNWSCKTVGALVD